MIVTVTRPYGGQEGKRIRVGTQFWVTKPGGKAKGPKGLTVISYERYRELSARRMVVEGDVDNAPQTAKVSTPRKAPGKNQGQRKAQPPTERQKSERRHKNQNGGRPGKAAESSSSPVDPAPGPSTGLLGRRAQRGQRVSDGSPSTTPSASAPGQTANTPQTGDGGGTTVNKSETGENETKPAFV